MLEIQFKVTDILWHVNCKDLGYVFIAIPDNRILDSTISTAREHIFPQLDSRLEEINSSKTGYGTIVLENTMPVDFLAAAFLDSHPKQTDLRPITHHLVWFPPESNDIEIEQIQALKSHWIFPILEHIKPVFDEVYTYSSLKEIREFIHENIFPIKIDLSFPIEEYKLGETINFGELSTKQETSIDVQFIDAEEEALDQFEKEELVNKIKHLFHILHKKLENMPISAIPTGILRQLEGIFIMLIESIDDEWN